ncbi:hypothetical protein KSP39_PZI009026 [Platanthera zijinensis]|uniref:FLZ-type domain-containing protein n=1 Tax=Platanthera zijinensis TaxID=2320716 RepID=A0AAP0BL95_9ASPA
MSHHSTPITSFTGNLTHRPISSSSSSSSSSLFPSTIPFFGFSTKLFSVPESTVKISNFTQDSKPRTSAIKHRMSPVGLSIVDSLTREKSSVAENRIVWLGSKIKVKIPSNSIQMAESPHTTVEFGFKNKDSLLAMSLLSPRRKSSPATAIPGSASEIELSEDYTCVISHGPQQKKTHIFDNFILESFSNEFSSLEKIKLPADQFGGYTNDCLLTFCHACRNKFAQGNDVFICRYVFVFFLHSSVFCLMFLKS